MLFSLTALKVLIGITLMGKASEYQYVNPVSRSDDNQGEQKVKPSSSEPKHNRSRSSGTDLHVAGTVSEPNISESRHNITRDFGRAKPRTTKSLSDIERFTLCSNRIV